MTPYYLSHDRTDVQFAVREFTNNTKEPNNGSVAKLPDFSISTRRQGIRAAFGLSRQGVQTQTGRIASAMLRIGGRLLYCYARSLQMFCLSSACGVL